MNEKNRGIRGIVTWDTNKKRLPNQSLEPIGGKGRPPLAQFFVLPIKLDFAMNKAYDFAYHKED
jgi:hypothetical protein